MSYSIGEVRKAVVAALGMAATGLAWLLTNNLVPPQYVAAVGAVLTILGVFGIRNDPPKPVVTAASAAVDAVTDVVNSIQHDVRESLPPIVVEKIDDAVGAVSAVNDIIDGLIKKRTA